MKQQINPLVAVVCVVVAIAALLFLGMRLLNPPAPTDVAKPTLSNKPAEINGHAVPNNVPYDYMQKSTQAPGGSQGPNSGYQPPSGGGIAPRQMPGGGPGQMPHP
jgi:hypothetical protein